MSKEPMTAEDVADLQDAVRALKDGRVPPDKRAQYAEALKKTYAQMMEEMDPPEENSHLGQALASAGMGIADYAGGLVRTPVMAALAALAGRGDTVHVQDFKDAANPLKPAPSSGEWLERMGVPPGKSLSDAIPGLYSETGDEWTKFKKGGFMDPTARGAAGAGLDMALSPGGLSVVKALRSAPANTMTAVERQAALAELRNAAIRDSAKKKFIKGFMSAVQDPAAALQGGMGRKLYESALTTADLDAMKNGGRAASEVLRENNAWGGDRSLLEQSKLIRAKKAAEIRDIVDSANTEGLTVPRKDIRMPTTEYLLEQSNVPGQKIPAQRAWNTVSREFSEMPRDKTQLNLDDLLQLKDTYQGKAASTGGYSDVPAAAGAQRPVLTEARKKEAEILAKAYAAQAKTARSAAENLLDSASPGAGGEMWSRNRDIGSMIAAEKALDANARSKSWYSGEWRHAARVPAIRTGVGLLLDKTAPATSNLLRSSLLENYGKDIRQLSPWEQLQLEMQGLGGNQQ